MIPWSTLRSMSTFIQIFQKLTLEKKLDNLISKTKQDLKDFNKFI